MSSDAKLDDATTVNRFLGEIGITSQSDKDTYKNCQVLYLVKDDANGSYSLQVGKNKIGDISKSGGGWYRGGTIPIPIALVSSTEVKEEVKAKEEKLVQEQKHQEEKYQGEEQHEELEHEELQGAPEEMAVLDIINNEFSKKDVSPIITNVIGIRGYMEDNNSRKARQHPQFKEIWKNDAKGNKIGMVEIKNTSKTLGHVYRFIIGSNYFDMGVSIPPGKKDLDGYIKKKERNAPFQFYTLNIDLDSNKDGYGSVFSGLPNTNIGRSMFNDANSHVIYTPTVDGEKCNYIEDILDYLKYPFDISDVDDIKLDSNIVDNLVHAKNNELKQKNNTLFAISNIQTFLSLWVYLNINDCEDFYIYKGSNFFFNFYDGSKNVYEILGEHLKNLYNPEIVNQLTGQQLNNARQKAGIIGKVDDQKYIIFMKKQSI